MDPPNIKRIKVFMFPTSVYSYEQSTSSQPHVPTLPSIRTLFAAIPRTELAYSQSPHILYPPLPIGTGSAEADLSNFTLSAQPPLTRYLPSMEMDVNPSQENPVETEELEIEQESSHIDTSSIDNTRLEVAREAYHAKPCKYNVVVAETERIIENNPHNFEARLLKSRAHFKKYQRLHRISDIKEIIKETTLLIKTKILSPEQLIEVYCLRARAYIIKSNRQTAAEPNDCEQAIADLNIVIKQLTNYLSLEQTLDVHFLRGKAYFKIAPHYDNYINNAYEDFYYVIQLICPLNQFNCSAFLPKKNSPHFKCFTKALKYITKICIIQKDGLGAHLYAKTLNFLVQDDRGVEWLFNNASDLFNRQYPPVPLPFSNL